MSDLSLYKSLLRLYLPAAEMRTGSVITLSDAQHHYLRNVMRKEAGARLRVFNGQDGEGLAVLQEINKKNAVVELLQLLSEQKPSPDILIFCSIVKKEAFDFMIEKSAELGASRFLPVITDHTAVHRFNIERAQATAIDACEQCERMDIMTVDEARDLDSYLKSWDKSRKLIFCIEREKAPSIITALSARPAGEKYAVLVGPEGGFSLVEVERLQALDFVIPVSLGPRILRAETALVSALTCLQAVKGDWS